MQEQTSRSNDALKYLLAGASGLLVGAIVGLLFAPKPGREMRAEIKTKAQELGEKAKVVAAKTKELARELRTHALNYAGGNGSGEQGEVPEALE